MKPITGVLKQLKRSLLFADCTDKEINLILERLDWTVEKYAQRDVVYAVHAPVDALTVVLEGHLVEYSISNNKINVRNNLIGGAVYGMPYCFTGDGADYATVAAEETSALVITSASVKEVNQELYSEAAQKKMTEDEKKELFSYALAIGHFLTNLTLCQAQKMDELRFNNKYMSMRGMRKKIAAFIIDKYDEQQTATVKLGVDRNTMAKILHASRPSMGREMIAMRDEDGLFSFRKDKIEIYKPEELRRIANN